MFGEIRQQGKELTGKNVKTELLGEENLMNT